MNESEPRDAPLATDRRPRLGSCPGSLDSAASSASIESDSQASDGGGATDTPRARPPLRLVRSVRREAVDAHGCARRHRSRRGHVAGAGGPRRPVPRALQRHDRRARCAAPRCSRWSGSCRAPRGPIPLPGVTSVPGAHRSFVMVCTGGEMRVRGRRGAIRRSPVSSLGTTPRLRVGRAWARLGAAAPTAIAVAIGREDEHASIGGEPVRHVMAQRAHELRYLERGSERGVDRGALRPEDASLAGSRCRRVAS